MRHSHQINLILSYSLMAVAIPLPSPLKLPPVVLLRIIANTPLVADLRKSLKVLLLI